MQTQMITLDPSTPNGRKSIQTSNKLSVVKIFEIVLALSIALKPNCDNADKIMNSRY